MTIRTQETLRFHPKSAKSGAGLSLCTTIDVLMISKDVRTFKDLTPSFHYGGSIIMGNFIHLN